MKSNPSVENWSIVGWIDSGTAYPLARSQSPSASPWDERTVTASYGPTVSWETTCTLLLPDTPASTASSVPNPPALADEELHPPEVPSLSS